MKTIKLILTAILLMVVYVANAQTIQVYKDGAVVKEYSSAEVDSVVYKPAAAEPRYYYYAGWDCPSSVEGAEETSLVNLIKNMDGIKSYGIIEDTNVGFSSSRPFASMPNTLTDKEWVMAHNYQTRYQYIIIPDNMKIYDADDITVEVSGVTYFEDKSVTIDNHKVFKSEETILASAKFAVY